MQAVENPILTEQFKPMSAKRFEHYCNSCEGEIFEGMEYAALYIEGDYKRICEECYTVKKA